MLVASKNIFLIFFAGLVFAIAGYHFIKKAKPGPNSLLPPPALEKASEEFLNLKTKTSSIKKFIAGNNYNSKICFLIDMKIASGKKRFFVYDLRKDSVLLAGLVAHGSCDNGFQPEADFSNKINSGCSCTGKFGVGQSYTGKFGLAFKLYGLDSSNNNAFERSIVLHAYNCVPDEEVYPLRVCNSRGCPMVSINFLKKLKGYIENSSKPVLLLIFK
ncbi:MAG: murein L,D-transpeptidase catalytic domain-containing protein [Ferruginibacter sp.]